VKINLGIKFPEEGCRGELSAVQQRYYSSNRGSGTFSSAFIEEMQVTHLVTLSAGKEVEV
jgi:hypothetical protein